MDNLVENILEENYVSANQIFEDRLAEIMEKKLYEKKKMMQAEAFGGMSKQDIERRKKAGFMKAADYFAALNTAKEIEKKSKSDIEPKSKKKKVDEAYTGTGSGSDKELEARAKGAAVKLGQAVKSAAAARAARVSREQEKRAARKKRGASAEPGKPYVSPAVKSTSGGEAPKVELEPSDVRKPSGDVDRSKSRVFSSDELKKASKAPPRASDAWQSDKDTAYALRRAGDKEAVGKFRKAYSGYRAKRELKGFGSAMGGFAKGIISGLQEDTE